MKRVEISKREIRYRSTRQISFVDPFNTDTLSFEEEKFKRNVKNGIRPYQIGSVIHLRSVNKETTGFLIKRGYIRLIICLILYVVSSLIFPWYYCLPWLIFAVIIVKDLMKLRERLTHFKVWLGESD